MKGLSTILAMILIVIIVVALIGLTYTFAANLFGQTTDVATGTVETTTRNMDKHVEVIGSVLCKNISVMQTAAQWSFIFTLKHGGSTYSINSGKSNELTAMIDNTIIPNANITELGGASTGWTTTEFPPQNMRTFNLTVPNITAGTLQLGYKMDGTRTLRITSPAGTISETVQCNCVNAAGQTVTC